MEVLCRWPDPATSNSNGHSLGGWISSAEAMESRGITRKRLLSCSSDTNTHDPRFYDRISRWHSSIVKKLTKEIDLTKQLEKKLAVEVNCNTGHQELIAV